MTAHMLYCPFHLSKTGQQPTSGSARRGDQQHLFPGQRGVFL
jgi:hypothetical protein